MSNPTQFTSAQHEGVPSPSEFDQLFESEATFPGFGQISRLVDPQLPPGIEPFSFLSFDLLTFVAKALDVTRGHVIADLGCGRGGPGLWIAETTGVSLVGVDFSPIAVAHASQKATEKERADRATFVVGELTATGLKTASVDAVVSIDALPYASSHAAAAREIRRVLRPGGRLVLTGWHPRNKGDVRIPSRHRYTDWVHTLSDTGFVDIECQTHPAWTETYLRTYQMALEQGDPGGDVALAGLQGEARRRLPSAHLLDRVVVSSSTPVTQPNE